MDLLKDIPYRPFLCLPMSAILYAILKDNHQIEFRLVTGNLSYNGQYIFKQKFSIAKVAANSFHDEVATAIISSLDKLLAQ